ncbi:MAG: response regulator, partial [Deltaproteobacteria bacterium]|nr:response regulator [Deltaproteobacteria bacterium]
MIVDDDLSMTLNLEEILTNGGYEVVGSAHTGEAALEMARRYHPDLVIMDINLGRGMDGIEAAGQLLDELKIPCIFISGHDNHDFIERAKECRPLGYILKPVNDRQILADIEIALSEIEARKKWEDFFVTGYPPGFIEKYPDLTPTELRVAYQISNEKTTKEVAEALSISETTVQ